MLAARQAPPPLFSDFKRSFFLKSIAEGERVGEQGRVSVRLGDGGLQNFDRMLRESARESQKVLY